MTKTLQKALQYDLKKGGEDFKVPPLWLMRQAGRYLPEYRQIRKSCDGFLDLCYTPAKACEVTMQPLRRYNFDGAILFSDILVTPHALGQNVWFEEGVGPKLEPLKYGDDVYKLGKIDFHNHLSPVYETVERIKGQLITEGFKTTTFIGFAGAPWTVATYMIEGGSSRNFATIKQFAYTYPKAFADLLTLLADYTAEYLIKQIDCGVEVVQIFDSWAGVLNEMDFNDFCIYPTARIVKKIKQKHPHIPIIGFPRGAGFMTQNYVKETGVHAVGLDETVPMESMQSFTIPVQGNLDPQVLRAGGDILQKSVLKIKESMTGRPYVFNLGRGIEKETPPEHVEQLVKWVRE